VQAHKPSGKKALPMKGAVKSVPAKAAGAKPVPHKAAKHAPVKPAAKNNHHAKKVVAKAPAKAVHKKAEPAKKSAPAKKAAPVKKHR
jgi:DNA-binding protein HU-beta